MNIPSSESVLIVDFGSQVTQLIARRVREAGVYSEIAPFSAAKDAFRRMDPAGVILSGSPASVLDENGPRIPDVILDSGRPILGICYGQQSLMHQLGGEVLLGDSGEFGRAFIEIEDDCALFDFPSKRFAPLPCPRAPRLSAQLVPIDGRLYLVGGSTESASGLASDRSIEVFDPARGSWHVALSELPFDTRHARALAFGKSILIVSTHQPGARARIALVTFPSAAP